jgi:hypothetical protein
MPVSLTSLTYLSLVQCLRSLVINISFAFSSRSWSVTHVDILKKWKTIKLFSSIPSDSFTVNNINDCACFKTNNPLTYRKADV